MNASKFFLKAANSLVTAIVALFLILAAAYSGYALWDNAQVYGAVDDIQLQGADPLLNGLLPVHKGLELGGQG